MKGLVSVVAAHRPSRVLKAIPYAVMVVVAVVDLTAGAGVGFLPLMSLGPAFAGLVGGWRRTAWIGSLALVLTVALGVYDDLLAHRRGLTALVSVAGVTVAGLVAAVMRQQREEELASVRSIAEAAQRVLLRPVPLAAGSLRVAVSYTSAVADARIGGDLYEVVATPYGVRTIVGDVQGKGLEAVETAAVVLGAFREAAYDEPTLTAVGERLEHALERHLTAEKFVTAVLAESGPGADPGCGPEPSMTLLNYGHPAPLVVRRDGTAAFLAPPERALPLGLALHGTKGPHPHTVDFAAGDQMLFYTDGVSEARDAEDRFYPLEQRAALLRDPDPEAAVEALRQDLVAHTQGPPHDDAAMLLVRYRSDEPCPSPGADAVR
ncbi:PP2C family protein-serine/threonine phosphatase [Streptomyces buecherae]|uniref:Serine/threonine-protein phosphatase n=1 Tax=Streptomyces buecherae TaxID=2763006 RepID=A0A7H8NAG4_9ACTN|nr:PP2C family protein-serine/threonine phosphatase [Streptomyces buecherae]QKW51362.1 serine/threonine-protein phosphatase [Streptomyces buecherae]